MTSTLLKEAKYRGLLYSAQSTFKQDPGRVRQKSLVTAGTNFTKPGAHNKGDLCSVGRDAYLGTTIYQGGKMFDGPYNLVKIEHPLRSAVSILHGGVIDGSSPELSLLGKLEC